MGSPGQGGWRAWGVCTQTARSDIVSCQSQLYPIEAVSLWTSLSESQILSVPWTLVCSRWQWVTDECVLCAMNEHGLCCFTLMLYWAKPAGSSAIPFSLSSLGLSFLIWKLGFNTAWDQCESQVMKCRNFFKCGRKLTDGGSTSRRRQLLQEN
jgi:hypothetical protein